MLSWLAAQQHQDVSNHRRPVMIMGCIIQSVTQLSILSDAADSVNGYCCSVLGTVCDIADGAPLPELAAWRRAGGKPAEGVLQ